jgi:excisionase family DNA binding protein
MTAGSALATESVARSVRIGEQLLSISEVSGWLGVSESWIRDHAAKRRRPYLPAYKMGKTLKFRRSDIERFLEELRTQWEARRP